MVEPPMTNSEAPSEVPSSLGCSGNGGKAPAGEAWLRQWPIYIYINCLIARQKGATNAGSHFRWSFTGTVAKVSQRSASKDTCAVQTQDPNFDPFTNFSIERQKYLAVISLFLGVLCLAILLGPGALHRFRLRRRLDLRRLLRCPLRRSLWRRFRRHDRLDVPAEPRE